jgi:predicted SAM-dependent methyltransferase
MIFFRKYRFIFGILVMALLSLGVYNRQPIYLFLKDIHGYLIQNHWIYHKSRESALAHQIIGSHLKGIEIGGSAQSPWGLNTLNVDYTDDTTTTYKQAEIAYTGTYAKVDIIASGDHLPLVDNSVDFVINAHVIEHFYDPIKALKEWFRVVRPGGYIFIIAPHKERTFDKDRPRTTLEELIDRHEHPNPPVPDHHGHYSVWITEDFLELCKYCGFHVIAYQDVDDKVGNGFTVVIQKD